MSRLAIALFWLLHWLPLSVLSRIGSAFGLLLYVLVPPRRRIALINLGSAFPNCPQPGAARSPGAISPSPGAACSNAAWRGGGAPSACARWCASMASNGSRR